MSKKNIPVVSFCLALLIMLISPSSMFADEWDQVTKLTFSEPVEVPGIVLEAGTYWFKLADSPSDRNIVEIWNADRTHLITTILAIPDYRVQPSDKTVITFEERPTGSPEAISAWFYPGENYGQEFVYPKSRAMQLAKQTNRPVLSMPDQQPAPQLKQAPVKGVTPSEEEVDLTEVVVSQPATPLLAARSTLPQTASPLPLLALLGSLALACGGVLRLAVRRGA